MRWLVVVASGVVGVSVTTPSTVAAAAERVAAGAVLEVMVPEAIGGKVVVGNLAVDQQAGPGFVTAYACDQSKPLASDLNFVAGPPTSNRFVGRAGQDGRICFSPNVATHIIFDANGILGGATMFANRRIDTRAGQGASRVAAGAVVEATVPEAIGGKVVIGNLAVDQQSGPGFVTAFACDQPRPFASDLNFPAVGAASNRFIGRAGQDGRICFSPNVATHIIFDANGILGGATPFANRRTDSRLDPGTKPSPTRALEVLVPEAVGGKVVIGNLAVDQQVRAGFVTAHTCGALAPLVSDLNFPASGATSNRFIGRAGADGRICFSPSVSAHVIVDSNAIVVDATPFPNRRTDTRDLGACATLWGSLEKVDPSMSPSPLLNIRAGPQPCFDRLVFDIDGPAGGYAVRYVAQMTHIASGEPIPLRGGAFLEVIVRVPDSDLDGNLTYPRAGSSELVDLTGYRTFRQAAWAGSQEGVTAIGLGVRARLPFRVFVLAGPGAGSRLVVDVAHEW